MFPIPDFAVQPVAVAAAGGGLVLVGLANLLFARPGPRARAIGSVAATAVYVAGLRACFEATGVAATAGAILAAFLVACLVADSVACRKMVATVAKAAARPYPRWALVSALGLLLVVCGFGTFDAAEERKIDDDMAWLTSAAESPPITVGARLQATTDRGALVDVGLPSEVRDAQTTASIEENYFRRTPHLRNVICREPADAGTNCHGWVFTGGRFLVGGVMVERILADNGYESVTEPRPGDLVVYRAGNEQVLHSGIVRYVTPGMPVLVEGKWGALGVFLHAADKSCYGTNYTFYRSPRTGHLLASLPAAPTTQAQMTGAE
jgi:hypothetical protein